MGVDPVLSILAEAADALSGALDDLELWATSGPETFTSEERKRFKQYQRVLASINQMLAA